MSANFLQDLLSDDDPVVIAPKLLGVELRTEIDGVATAGLITEVEAYRAPEDRASHAYNYRRTARTEPFYAPAGTSYVYLCYGIHELFNVVTGPEGVPHAILIRAIEPTVGVEKMLERRGLQKLKPQLSSGPGVVSKALGISRAHNMIDLLEPNNPVQLRMVGAEVPSSAIVTTPRIGIDGAGPEWVAKPWRFYRSGTRFVSRLTRGPALILLFLLSFALGAQDENLKFYDNTYVDHIKTVRLHIAGFPNSYPIVELGGAARLRLSFDDLSDEVRRYTYKFIHCDRDWTPSNLGALEYNSGYANDYVEDYDFSLRTLKEYIHYDLIFPNRNMRLERSGNYLLVVYDSENEDVPVITRRFMVAENVAGVSGRVTRPSVVSKIHTHQEVELQVNTKQLQPRAPLQEISATVLQNGRWDNAVVGIAPNLLGRESVQFNYQDKIVFRGGNEFRNLDVRSVQAPRTEIVSLTNEGDRYAMLLAPEKTRENSTYIQYFDLNGDFVNFRFDRPVVNLADEFLQDNFERFGLDFTGEYLEVTFVLKTNNGLPIEKDLYLFGVMTEWQLKRDYRMVWNPSISAYVGRALFKQGFFNYYYVTDEGKATGQGARLGDRAGYQQTEDSFDETENDYIGLIYFRPMGGRYDRLVGTTIFNSSRP